MFSGIQPRLEELRRFVRTSSTVASLGSVVNRARLTTSKFHKDVDAVGGW